MLCYEMLFQRQSNAVLAEEVDRSSREALDIYLPSLANLYPAKPWSIRRRVCLASKCKGSSLGIPEDSSFAVYR
jgi:hypothetical protein